MAKIMKKLLLFTLIILVILGILFIFEIGVWNSNIAVRGIMKQKKEEKLWEGWIKHKGKFHYVIIRQEYYE